MNAFAHLILKNAVCMLRLSRSFTVMAQQPLSYMALFVLSGCVQAHRQSYVLIAGDGGTFGWE